MTKEKSYLRNIAVKVRYVDVLMAAGKTLALDPVCTEILTQAQKQIFSQPAAIKALENAEKALFDAQEEDCWGHIMTASQACGVCKQTCTAVMLIHGIVQLRKKYLEKGLPESLMWDTLIDLKCKLVENYELTGIWGTDAVGWYTRLYNLKIIKLGRLEFEPIGYRWDTPYRGIHKGDPVMNMHIPSTGPMKIEDVLAAFKQAYQFYGYTEPMPVAAASWLLYPPLCEEVMKPGSNMKKLYDLFQVVEQYEDPENHNFWRIFNVEYEPGVLDKVPLDNSLRRGIYEFMKSGRNMGIGRCMLLFDGENVISK